MHALSVGKPYIPGRSRWPEVGEYNYRAGANELRIFWGAPTASEVESVRKGPALFGLYTQGDLLILCYRFGSLPWSDAPYSIHLLEPAGVPPEDRVPPDPASLTPESRALLDVVLIDAGSGIVRALRTVTFSPEFTGALYYAIAAQARMPFDKSEYDESIERVYRTYPTDRLAAACQVQCKGGD